MCAAELAATTPHLKSDYALADVCEPSHSSARPPSVGLSVLNKNKAKDSLLDFGNGGGAGNLKCRSTPAHSRRTETRKFGFLATEAH